MSAKHLLLEKSLDLVMAESASSGRKIRWYIEQGKEIPDYLLPGRAVMRMSQETRQAFASVTSDDMADVGDWWVKVICAR